MTTFKMDGTGVVLGPFDSDNRYLREVADSSDRVFYGILGPSIAVSVTVVGSNSVYNFAWRWQVGAASKVGQDAAGRSTGNTPPSGFNTPRDVAL